MLKEIIPAVDLGIYLDPVMCIQCARTLYNSYKFKTQCLETELKFHSWISQRNNVEHDEVNLVLLVESSTDNDYLDEVSGKETETITKQNVEDKTKPKQQELLSGEETQTEACTRGDAEDAIKEQSFPMEERNTEAHIENELLRPEISTVENIDDEIIYEIIDELIKEQELSQQTRKREENIIEDQLLSNPEIITELNMENAEEEQTKIAEQNLSSNGKETEENIEDELSSDKIVEDEEPVEIETKVKKKSNPKNKPKRITIRKPMVVKPHLCEKCGQTVENNESLLMHMLSHGIVINDKVEKCPHCHWKVGDALIMKRHFLRKHGLPSLDCEDCGKNFKSLKTLRIHRNSQHLGKVKQRQCRVCGKTFNSASSLYIHSVVHDPDKYTKFLCDLCGKKFAFKKEYEAHMRSHDSKAHFVCNICDRTLKRPENFRKHMRTFHENKGKFKCEICELGFWRRQGLLNHGFKKHGIRFEEKKAEAEGL